MITGMNHAVLYVRDARRQQAFYTDVLGFETVVADPNGAFVFLRAPGSSNHHDLACFTIGADASDSTAGRTQVGLYHLAWEVPTLADLEIHRQRLLDVGALRGASDHGVNKSLYAHDPDGIEFEVMWLVPEVEWGDEAHQAIVRPLDLDADANRYGGDRISGVRRESHVGGTTVAGIAGTDRGLTAEYCHFYDDAAFIETERAGFRRRVITGDHVQLCFWRIAGGATGSVMHHHDAHEQLGIIMRGGLDFRIGDPDDPRRVVLGEGDVYLAPATVSHGDSVFIGDDEYGECWILDVFGPPRADLSADHTDGEGSTP